LGRHFHCLDDPRGPLLVAVEPVQVEQPVVQLKSQQSFQTTVDFASVKSNFIKLMTQQCLKTL